MNTADAVLAVARAEIGYAEGAGNDTKYGSWYGLNRNAWCAMFISWCADRADATDIIPKHAYTPSGAAWFAARGAFSKGAGSPRVGAIVYYDIAGMGRISHVGIVEAVFGDGSWISIEGNTDVAGGRTGGRVMRQHRSKVGARGGFGYPAYGAKYAGELIPTPAPVPAPPPSPRLNDQGNSLRLVEDGDFGPATIARLQESLNRTGARPVLRHDGDFGPATKRALQSRLNHTNGPVSIDGEFGPKSTKALQRNIGVSADGAWGQITTRALQGVLNRREL